MENKQTESKSFFRRFEPIEQKEVKPKKHISKKRKYDYKELENFVTGDLVYPNKKGEHLKLIKQKEKYLNSLPITDKQREKIDEFLCPYEYWYSACDVVSELSDIILKEREENYEIWMNCIENIELELKELKKRLKS